MIRDVIEDFKNKFSGDNILELCKYYKLDKGIYVRIDKKNNIDIRFIDNKTDQNDEFCEMMKQRLIFSDCICGRNKEIARPELSIIRSTNINSLIFRNKKNTKGIYYLDDFINSINDKLIELYFINCNKLYNNQYTDCEVEEIIKYFKNALLKVKEYVDENDLNEKTCKIHIIMNSNIKEYQLNYQKYIENKAFNKSFITKDGKIIGSTLNMGNEKKTINDSRRSCPYLVDSEYLMYRTLMYSIFKMIKDQKIVNRLFDNKYNIKYTITAKGLIIEDITYNIQYFKKHEFEQIMYIQNNYKISKNKNKITKNQLINDIIIDGEFIVNSNNENKNKNENIKIKTIKSRYKYVIEKFLQYKNINIGKYIDKIMKITFIYKINKIDKENMKYIDNYFSVMNYFYQNECYEGEISMETIEKIVEKMKNNRTEYKIENDDEFYFVIGQSIKYLAYLSKSLDVNSIVFKRNLFKMNQYKNYMKYLYERYCYSFGSTDKSFINVIYNALLSYKYGEDLKANLNNQFMFSIGATSKNLVSNKNIEETMKGNDDNENK